MTRELQIRPEPAPAERRVLLAALEARARAAAPLGESAWWRAGLPGEPLYATARPRSRRGATRA